MQKQKKIAILGGGNIGMAIASGFSKSGSISKENITITRIASQPLNDVIAAGFKATHSNETAVKDADYILFAVQPRQANNMLKALKQELDPKKHIIYYIFTFILIITKKKMFAKQQKHMFEAIKCGEK